MSVEESVVAMATSMQYIVVWVGCCSLAFMALCAYCGVTF